MRVGRSPGGRSHRRVLCVRSRGPIRPSRGTLSGGRGLPSGELLGEGSDGGADGVGMLVDLIEAVDRRAFFLLVGVE